MWPPPSVPHRICRNRSSCFLCFKGLINHTQGEEKGGQRGISKEPALGFSKASPFEFIMTRLKDAFSFSHCRSRKNAHHRFANPCPFPGLGHRPIELLECAEECVTLLFSPYRGTRSQVCVCGDTRACMFGVGYLAAVLNALTPSDV